MLLGGFIGVERELACKPAGFRTHMLVAGAAALLVGLGDALLYRFNAVVGMGASLRSDPIRIVETIVTGISFPGSGTIFRRTDKAQHVKGLTTAVSILLSSAIGISVALRQFALFIGATLLALMALRGFEFIHNWIENLRQKKTGLRFKIETGWNII